MEKGGRNLIYTWKVNCFNLFIATEKDYSCHNYILAIKQGILILSNGSLALFCRGCMSEGPITQLGLVRGNAGYHGLCKHHHLQQDGPAYDPTLDDNMNKG